jgi:ankyrin repeat protein
MRVLLRIFLVLACIFAAILILIAFVYRDRRPRVYFAAARGDTNSIALYLASGSNVNATINCYPFAEHYRLAPLLDIALENGQTGTVDFLLKVGADPNQPDSRGETPLMWVIGFTKNDVGQETRMEMLKMLLSAGADPHAPALTEYRYTPLIEAASLGQTDMARVLLNARADVKATNKIGQTALHLAGRHTEVAKLLLAAGADVNTRDVYGQTPIDYATRDGYTNTLAILTSARANTSH